MPIHPALAPEGRTRTHLYGLGLGLRGERFTQTIPRVRSADDRIDWVTGAFAVLVTAMVGLGVGWSAGALFGLSSSERWDRAWGFAISSSALVVVTGVVQRWQSRRERASQKCRCAVRVVGGSVSGLRERWAFGRAAFSGGEVCFRRWRFAGLHRGGDDVRFSVVGRTEPRAVTLRESLRVGGDAQVVVLFTSVGARVQLAAVLPGSMVWLLSALGV